jgi:hypothetical protein
MIDFVVNERRPVYTNQPMRWKELRAWLEKKHGPEVANLIRPLTHRLFETFMERVTKQAAFLREWREDLASTGSPLLEDDEARFEAEQAAWREHAGEDVYSNRYGENFQQANSIPPTACILIDELHEWYPSKTYQGKDGESKWVLDFMTMHRHTMHKLIFATQRSMQVSHTIRNLAHTWYFVTNKRDQRLLWNIRFEHVAKWFPSWKTIIGIRRYTAMDIDPSGAPKIGAKPVSDDAIFASFPHNLWVFGLYDSHSRLGSEAIIMKALAQVRAEAGLDPEGRTPSEVAEAEARAKKESTLMHKTVQLLLTFLKKLTWAAVLIVIGFGLAKFTGREWNVSKTEQTAKQTESDAPTEPEDPYAAWHTLDSISNDYARLGGTRVFIGSTHQGHTLQAISIPARGVLWLHDDTLSVQRVGDARPTVLGPASRVRAIAARFTRDGDTTDE